MVMFTVTSCIVMFTVLMCVTYNFEFNVISNMCLHRSCFTMKTFDNQFILVLHLNSSIVLSYQQFILVLHKGNNKLPNSEQSYKGKVKLIII